LFSIENNKHNLTEYLFFIRRRTIMSYKNLGDLNKKGQTWNIKVKVIRLWESINNKTEELMSLDMILMDEKVTFYLYILKY
jgi:hypothetical protein